MSEQTAATTTSQRLQRRGLMAGVVALVGAGLGKLLGAGPVVAGHDGSLAYNPSNVMHLGLINDGGNAANNESASNILTETSLVAAVSAIGLDTTLKVVNLSNHPALRAIAGAANADTGGIGIVVNGGSSNSGTGGTGVLGVGGNSLSGTAGIGVSGRGGNGGIGVLGEDTPGLTQGVGVVGRSGITGTGSGTGVQGRSGNGPGVVGQSTGGFGVFGTSQSNAGVYGSSTQSIGVRGESQQSVGVFGSSANNFAFYGLSTGGVGFYGKSTGNIGVYAEATTGTALFAFSTSGPAAQFFGPVFVTGNHTVTGAKSAAVPHPDGSHRRLYSLECPESYFEDFGRANLVNGRADVRLDRDFAAVVRADDYDVFLTPKGDTNGLYVSQQTPTGFEVRETKGGTGSLAFSYRVVAKRKDIPGPRLEKVDLPPRVTLPPVPPPPPAPPRLEPVEPPGRAPEPPGRGAQR
jgi:hypothetical protein